MDPIIMYPKVCRKNIKRLVSAVGMSVETAYAMMLLNAALMDLRPEDDQIVEIILADCGIFPQAIAD